jgi:hypothetical protein
MVLVFRGGVPKQKNPAIKLGSPTHLQFLNPLQKSCQRIYKEQFIRLTSVTKVYQKVKTKNSPVDISIYEEYLAVMCIHISLYHKTKLISHAQPVRVFLYE